MQPSLPSVMSDVRQGDGNGTLGHAACRIQTNVRGDAKHAAAGGEGLQQADYSREGQIKQVKTIRGSEDIFQMRF